MLSKKFCQKLKINSIYLKLKIFQYLIPNHINNILQELLHNIY